ncbi:helix-turn-helix domain-containing protein [Azospirillum baldaniorum]|uniref:helix-turn-helix domain-containing protein n=1 Tax=Azospirillum baldaniorum TaxID=1064539 RepID=UPI0011AAC087|nr:helix-turn-helix transcriptional regulator [Azospirillum baldaniorum]
MDRKIAFGLRLRAIRKAQGMSQEQFAELLDRSPDAVSNMERGINLPSVETLIRLSDKLDIPLGHLFAALDAVEGTDGKRVSLESALAENARRLTLRDLEIALKQIEAFPKDD